MAIHSHVLLMTLFSALLAVAAAALLKDSWREQVWIGAQIFGGLMVGAIVLGWLLYVFPL